MALQRHSDDVLPKAVGPLPQDLRRSSRELCAKERLPTVRLAQRPEEQSNQTTPYCGNGYYRCGTDWPPGEKGQLDYTMMAELAPNRVLPVGRGDRGKRTIA